MTWLTASGVIVRGHGVASGTGGDPRFPAGTIALQLPFLIAAVPGFAAHLHGAAYPGTINLRLPGRAVTLRTPEHHLRGIRWTPHFPPEDFHLSACHLIVHGRRYPAFLYIPDPATKPDHLQPRDVVELLAARIPGIGYGDPAELACAAHAIAVAPDAGGQA